MNKMHYNFASFFSSTGHHDYFDHTAFEQRQWGFDIRRNMDVAFDLHGQVIVIHLLKNSSLYAFCVEIEVIFHNSWPVYDGHHH